MPFRSEAQRRFFHAAKAREEISLQTVSEWESETKTKNLPEKVIKKKAYEMGRQFALGENKK